MSQKNSLMTDHIKRQTDRKWKFIQFSLGHAYKTKMTTNKVKTPDDEYGGRLVHKATHYQHWGHGSC